MDLEINPKTVFNKLLLVILFLLFANILGIISKFYFHHDTVFGLVQAFNFDTEYNIPTLFSFLELILSTVLLFIIAKKHKEIGSGYIYWLVLMVIFLFLSFDEILSIHERLIGPVSELLNTSGILAFAWVVPYGVLLLIFVVAYSRFLIKLPRGIAALLIISGIIYVSGALGFELVGGKYVEQYGNDSIIYAICYTSEEFLEMLGIAAFIYTLLYNITIEFNSFSLTLIKKNIDAPHFAQ
ncbi:MAG: hypothetical protein GXO81_05550 [Chlorobi bacterium]|nr:hypothetical protein [Chlorobiota bacterium]